MCGRNEPKCALDVSLVALNQTARWEWLSFFSLSLVLFDSFAKQRENKRSRVRKAQRDLRGTTPRESDINTIVMPSRDFETIAIAMSKAVIHLLDFWINRRRGAAMQLCCILGNSEVRSFYQNRRIWIHAVYSCSV